MIHIPHFDFEEKYWCKNLEVAGIDEVGRGCLAGPLVVAAVIFAKDMSKEVKKNILNLGIRDSKQLSQKKREALINEIKSNATFYTLSFMSPEHINRFGISFSFKQALKDIVSSCVSNCQRNKISFLIDGLPISHIPYNDSIKSEFIVKGDSKSVSIAAASILAKVTRDLFMCDLSKKYPAYDWNLNKGYGTKKHIESIQNHGITPEHRTLFVRKILGIK